MPPSAWRRTRSSLGEGVGPAETAHRQAVRGPGADAGERDHLLDQLRRLGRGVERELTARDRAGERAQGRRAAGGDAQRRQIARGRAGDGVRRGKKRESTRDAGWRSPRRAALVSRAAIVPPAATLTCCPSTARAAASNGSKAPATRSPGRARTCRGQPPIAREVRGDRRGRGVEIEEPPQPRHHRHEGAREGGRDGGAQRRSFAIGIGRDRQPPPVRADGGGPQVDAVLHQLDARDGVRARGSPRSRPSRKAGGREADRQRSPAVSPAHALERHRRAAWPTAGGRSGPARRR